VSRFNSNRIVTTSIIASEACTALLEILCDQTYGPAGTAFGRLATHHRDNPLFLAPVEHRGGAGALPLEQRRFQTATLITTADRG